MKKAKEARKARYDPTKPIPADSEFNPYIPEGIAMELLEPVFRDAKEEDIASKDSAVLEQCQRTAYGIWRNGGARNQEELDELIKSGWVRPERVVEKPVPPGNAEEVEGVEG